MADHGLLDRIAVAIEQVADSSSDKVGTIGVEALLNEEIDVTKVHEPKVNRNFLALARLGTGSS